WSVSLELQYHAHLGEAGDDAHEARHLGQPLEDLERLLLVERVGGKAERAGGLEHDLVGLFLTEALAQVFRQLAALHAGNANTTVVVLWKPDMSPALSAISP